MGSLRCWVRRPEILRECQMKSYPDYLKELCKKYKEDFHPKKFVCKIERDKLIDSRFNIVLKYPLDIVEKIADFSEKLSSIIPATKYTEKNIHTTVSVFRGYEINSEIPEEDDEIVSRLQEAVNKIYQKINKKKIKIYLGKMLINSKSTILAGYPDDTFRKLLYNLDQVNNNYLRFRLAWGAHITTGRFNKEEEDPVILYEIHRLVDRFNINKEVSTEKPVITKFKAYPGIYEVEEISDS